MPGASASTPLTLPEILQRLVRERATGVLRVQGAEGWKVLDIQAGSIHLVTGTEGKRLRLGEILVARGKVAHEDVQGALDVQKRTGQPLGEVLAQRGLISRSDIQDIVRFQVGEEIYDLFTWKGAECTFEPNHTLGEQVNGYSDVAKLAIDPQRVLAEAASRIPAWQRIERVIYSPNMSFRLTDRGRSMLDTATRGGRKLLELMAEGYSIEFIARKAMVGRFSIWSSLAELIDAQAATPVPDEELPALAQGWESQGKLEQALGAYLRLVEVTADRARNAECRGKCRELRERITAREDGAPQGAPQRTGEPRVRNVLTPILVASTILIVVIAAVYVTYRVVAKPSAQDLRPYHAARAEASEFEKENDLAKARRVWKEYLVRYPEGIGAEMAGPRLERLVDRYEGAVGRKITEAQALEKENRFAEAQAVYDEILDRYPDTRELNQVRKLLTEAQAKAGKFAQQLTQEQLAEKLQRGRDLLGEKRYSEALSCLQTVVDNLAETGSELRNEARELLKVVEEAEEKAEALIERAQVLEQEHKLDEAVNVYKACFDLWARSRAGGIAADKLTTLGQDRGRAQRLYEKGLQQYAGGDFTGAVGNLKRAAGYEGFRVAGKAKEKLKDLAAANERSVELLKRAERLEAEGKREEAVKTLVELVDRYPHTLAAKNARVDVRIESVPSGASVRFNGANLGTTPVTVKLSPNDSGDIVLTKPGFAVLEEHFEAVRSPEMLYHLQREVLFRRNVGRPVRASPVSAGDRMVVRSGELLTLFLTTSGAVMWQKRVGDPAGARAKPSVMEDTVYAAAAEPRLMAFYLTDGGKRAEYPLPSPVVTTPLPIRMDLLAGRLFVVVCCRDGEVVSLDVTARREHWSVRVPPPIRYDPVVTERAVIVPCPGRQIVAFSLLNGSELWRENVSGEVAGNLALDAAGKHVALVTSLGTVQRFPVEQGGRKYDAEVDGVHGGGVALEGDIAYVGGDDGKVRAIEMRTGKEIWSRKVDGPVRDAPVVHAGMIYVGTEAGSLIAYDKETGVEQWKLDAGSSVVASPLALDDRLVIGTLDGAVIGLEVASAPASGR